MKDINKKLNFSKHTLFSNAAYNFIGKILPLIVGLIVIPILINRMGIERFGILTIAWMFIGYFNIFDIGMGRATTKFVAEYLALDKFEELPSLIWTSIIMLFTMGLVGGLTGFFLTPILVHNVFNISPVLQEEAKHAFYVLCACAPFVLSNIGMRGVLEAQQKFKLINVIKIPAGLANFLGPLLVLYFSSNLFIIVCALFSVKLCVWLAFCYFCLNSLPDINRLRLPKIFQLKKLLSFGGWLSISKIVWPVMMDFDRLAIGTMLSMKAVAFYVTPYEIVSRLDIVHNSIIPVLFPGFTGYAALEKKKLASMQMHTVKILLLILVPIVIFLVVFAQPFLHLWVGAQFAENSTNIMQLLAVGMLIYSITNIPAMTIQAMGRPDLIAKMRLLELPVFLGLIWISLHQFGLIGLAFSWMLRTIIDNILLFWLAGRLLPLHNISIQFFNKIIFLSGIFCVATYYLSKEPNIMVKIIFFLFLLGCLLASAWRFLLDCKEKEMFLLLKNRLLNFAK